jgi:HPt (histidine-containing phosphotransfer) domain-containing protein
MHKLRFSFLILVVFLTGAAAFSQTPQWSKEAHKLQNNLKTLNTLASINLFPAEVPGMETAITNKTQQMMDDLAALQTALQTEMPSLDAAERQEALGTLSDLLMQTADIGNMLAVREFGALTMDLVTSYNAVRTSYYSLAQQYSMTTRRLPIGTQMDARGSWIPW